MFTKVYPKKAFALKVNIIKVKLCCPEQIVNNAIKCTVFYDSLKGIKYANGSKN